MAPSIVEQNLESHLTSSHSIPALLAFLVIPFVLYYIGNIIWTAFFDPLSHVPGPKLWVAFPIVRWISLFRGRLDRDIRALHNSYGEAVRFSPNEVSFNTAQGWTDIYSFKNQPQLPKPATRSEPGRPPSIISANDTDHSRMRRALAHGFSERALREQEGLMQGYIDLLISKLKDVAVSGQPTNMVRWYNFTTFDIIGDLSFGTPFDCLISNEYHYWVLNTIKVIQYSPYIQFILHYPLLGKLIKRIMPKSINTVRDNMFNYTRTAVDRRLNDKSQDGRYDFIDALTKDNIVHDEEIYGNATILVLAGSETTATLLSGATYYLLANPCTLGKAVSEIRSLFKSESEINLIAVNSSLPYLNAVLDESLRLYPPVASFFMRITAHPHTICDIPIPAGTQVGVHHTATNYSATNFTHPSSFLPERWLPASKEDPHSEFYNDNRAAVQPFSVGPRNCIGKNLANSEMRLILARVLWNFDLEFADAKVKKEWDPRGQRSFTLWDKPELMCRLKVREGV